MGIENMSPEEIQAVIDGGYRAAGNVFRCAMDVLEARFGKEQAHEVGREIVRLKGQAAGKTAAARFGKGGFDNLKQAHLAGFPEIQVLEHTPTRYVTRDDHCAIIEGWRKSGLSDERVKELGDLYCPGDLFFAREFNPNIELDFQGRLAEGKPFCKWVFTLPHPPLP